MTRRIVCFVKKNGVKYVTPEFNGDKAEFEFFGMGDRCIKNWNEIEEVFRNCKTFTDFVKANAMAQSYYQSKLEYGEIQTVRCIRKNQKMPITDYIIYINER